MREFYHDRGFTDGLFLWWFNIPIVGHLLLITLLLQFLLGVCQQLGVSKETLQ